MSEPGRVRPLPAALLLTALVAYPFLDRWLQAQTVHAVTDAMIYVLLALGLNIVVGYAGLLDLGYAAFFAIGAYTMGLLNSPVLGGIGSMPGAALGGLMIGFLSAWSDQYISARWTNAIVFSILILVLIFRPQGLLGERVPDKA